MKEVIKTHQGHIFEEFDKENMAFAFLKEHEPEEGYFVGFSGGKDSMVVLDLVQRSGVKHEVYYSATGIDPPELVRFIKKYYPYVIWKYPNYKGHRSFFGMIPASHCVPNKVTRWCCNELKKFPTLSVPLKRRIMGIRAEESVRRAARPNPDYNKKTKCWTYKPIFYWKEWEVWEYIEKRNLPYCELYDNLLINRIGCVVCPFLSSKQHEIHRKLWPKHYHAFEKAMKKLWDERECKRLSEKGICFTFEDFLWKWYDDNVGNFKMPEKTGLIHEIGM